MKKKQEDEELVGHEAAIKSISEILHDYCGIPGCIPKVHQQDAEQLFKRLLNLGLIKEVN